MVGHQVFGLVEPKIGYLRQHFAFARDAVGHDAIKGGDAIGRDEQQARAQIEILADFAALEFFDTGQFLLQQWIISHGAQKNNRNGQS